MCKSRVVRSWSGDGNAGLCAELAWTAVSREEHGALRRQDGPQAQRPPCPGWLLVGHCLGLDPRPPHHLREEEADSETLHSCGLLSGVSGPVSPSLRGAGPRDGFAGCEEAARHA